MMALIGTPSGRSHSGEIQGHCRAGAVKRLLGCAAGVVKPRCHGFPSQSRHSAGGVSVMPSHHTLSSGQSATLVKMVFELHVAIALGLVFILVPGATPKNPASGLIAYSRPSAPN